MRMKQSGIEQVSRRSFLASAVAGGATLPFSNAIADSSTKPGKSTGNPILGENGGLHHVAIATNDWDRTLDFYQKGLGFSTNMIWSRAGNTGFRAGYFDSGNGAYVEVFEDRSFVPLKADENTSGSLVHPMWHLCLRTNRLDAAYENVLKFGATPLGAPRAHTLNTTTGQGAWQLRLCFLRGLSGEAIELIEGAP